MSENFYKEAFEEAMISLENEYKAAGNEDVFTMWFKTNIEYVEDTLDSLTLSVKTIFMQKIINKKGYFNQIKDKIIELTGKEDLQIKCVIKEDSTDFSDESNSNDKPNYSKNIEIQSSITEEITEEPVEKNTIGDYLKTIVSNSENKNPQLLKENFTFDNFIPGENSELPYKASIAVANNPGRMYNPLLIYGGSGLGKTHLMQAIGNAIHEKDSSLKIYYGTAESFANEFSSAIAAKEIASFNNKFRNLDVLLLDDIHFLDGKKGYQDQLFYTFDALHQKNSQMVFTCDRPLNEIKSMAERLVTRLSNGMYIDITIPNYETRIAILQKKIEKMGKYLEPEIIDYIAKNIETNVRDLESALNKVFGYADLIEKKPTLEICKNVLKDIINSNKDFVTVDIIMKVIADNYQISVSDLKSKIRSKKFSFPRQISAYLMRELLDLSYQEIGNELGGKDHSTIMHACTKIEDEKKLDSTLNAKIELFIRDIREYKK